MHLNGGPEKQISTAFQDELTFINGQSEKFSSKQTALIVGV
jgi:hypothetical protein